MCVGVLVCVFVGLYSVHVCVYVSVCLSVCVCVCIACSLGGSRQRAQCAFFFLPSMWHDVSGEQPRARKEEAREGEREREGGRERERERERESSI